MITSINGVSQVRQGQLLKPRLDKDGRLRASICAPDMSRDMHISRLVLMAFIGPAPEGTEGCHNDGDVSNNHYTNLRWDTHEENCRDIIRHGRSSWKNKERCPRNHLLKEPNLVVSQFKRDGHRSCQACDWAKSAIQSIFTWNNIKQPCPYSFETLADAYYAKIMNLPINPFVQLPRTHKERTHCKYEHILMKPNLVIRQLTKNNKRICLACQRAFTVKHNALARGEVINFRAVADKFYDEIMRTM